MKSGMVLAGLVLAAVSGGRTNDAGAGFGASHTASVQEQIRAIERERNVAVLAGDIGALDRMTSDDYTFITQRGEVRTKADILAGFKSGSFRYGTREVSDLVVRVYGDTAVVTGRAVQVGTENARDYSGENRFTRVYVKQGGRWLTVALQVTLVEKQR